MKQPLHSQPDIFFFNPNHLLALKNSYKETLKFDDITVLENEDFKLKTLLPKELAVSVEKFIDLLNYNQFGALIIKNFMPQIDPHLYRTFFDFSLILLRSALNSCNHWIDKGYNNCHSLKRSSKMNVLNPPVYYYPIVDSDCEYTITVFTNFNDSPCNIFSFRSIDCEKHNNLIKQLRKPIFKSHRESIFRNEKNLSKQIYQTYVPIISGSRFFPFIRMEILDPYLKQEPEAAIAVEEFRSLVERNLSQIYLNNGDVIICKNAYCYNVVKEIRNIPNLDYFFTVYPESIYRVELKEINFDASPRKFNHS